VHWISISKSLFIVISLALVIAYFMRKALKRDIIIYEVISFILILVDD